MLFFVCAFFIGSVSASVAYALFGGLKAVASGPPARSEADRPAGRIHLFEGDRYFDSSPHNPYEHSALNWADGTIACSLSEDLRACPEYQPAMIGTIRVFKPAEYDGLVAVIFDTARVAALGLAPVGLVSGAQMLVDSAIPEATLHAR